MLIRHIEIYRRAIVYISEYYNAQNPFFQYGEYENLQ